MNLIPETLQGIFIEYLPVESKKRFGLSFNVLKGEYCIPVFLKSLDLISPSSFHAYEIINEALTTAVEKLQDYYINQETPMRSTKEVKKMNAKNDKTPKAEMKTEAAMKKMGKTKTKKAGKNC